MVPRGIAKRYATALFNAARKAHIEEELRQELAGLGTLLRDNKQLRNFLLSPQVLTSAKTTTIENTFKDRASDLFVRFLLLLIEKKRFFFIEEMIDAYEHLYEQHKGILEVRVITAVPLDDATRQKTVEKLQSETGKQIKLRPTVDTDIIGGMIVIMEDKIIDGSIRHYLERLRRDLDAIRVE